METSYAISNIFKQLSSEVGRYTLASCVVFPRTSSLRDDKPLKTYEWGKVTDNGKQTMLDFFKLISTVKMDTEFVAVSTIRDLELVLEVLHELKAQS